MGWSEQYWEDVKSELEHSATEPEPAGEDQAPGQSGTDQSPDTPQKD
jgi:hypothetical protein